MKISCLFVATQNEKKIAFFLAKQLFFLLLAYNFIQLYGSFHIEWANTSTESVRKKRLHSKNLLPNTIKSPTVNNSEKRRLSTIMKLHKQSFWLNNVRQFPQNSKICSFSFKLFVFFAVFFFLLFHLSYSYFDFFFTFCI